MPTMNIARMQLDGHRDVFYKPTKYVDKERGDTNLLKSFSKLVDIIAKRLEHIDKKSEINTRIPNRGRSEENANPSENCHGRRFHSSLINVHQIDAPDINTINLQNDGVKASDSEETPQRLAGDFNNDGIVDLNDLNLYRNTEGQSGENLAADGNKDGVVNEDDRAILLENFGRTL